MEENNMKTKEQTDMDWKEELELLDLLSESQIFILSGWLANRVQVEKEKSYKQGVEDMVGEELPHTDVNGNRTFFGGAGANIRTDGYNTRIEEEKAKRDELLKDK